MKSILSYVMTKFSDWGGRENIWVWKRKELNNLCVSLSLENKLLSRYWDPEDGAMRILKNNKEGLK